MRDLDSIIAEMDESVCFEKGQRHDRVYRDAAEIHASLDELGVLP